MIRTTALVLSTIALPLAAQEIPDNLIRGEFIGGWETTSGTRMAAIRLTMAPGWHTYWRSPGEAGIPPIIDWGGSHNLNSVAFHWPVPQIFELNGMRTLGYEDELVLPIEITPHDAGPLELSANLDVGVCKDICVPATVQIDAVLPPSVAPDPDVNAALGRMPQQGPAAGLRAAHCSAEPIADGLRLRAELTIPATGPDEFAVIEVSGSQVWVSPVMNAREGNLLRLEADLVPPDAQPFALDRSTLRFTLFGGRTAVEVVGCTG